MGKDISLTSAASTLGRVSRKRPQRAAAIRLVGLDLDGTLLGPQKTISAACAATIAECVKRGVRVVLISARPPRSVRPIQQALGLDSLQVNYNGALIHHPSEGWRLYHRPLPAAVARQVVTVARALEPRLAVSVEVLDQWFTDWLDESLPTETSLHFKPDYIGPLSQVLNRPITKLMLLAQPERLRAVSEALEQRFAGRIAMAVSDQHLIQVMHPAVGKGKALARVAGYYKIPRAAVMAVGDAPNDAGMLRWAGLGVAVQNAWPEVQAAADVVVPSNEAEGVAIALERYVLSPQQAPAAKRSAATKA